ncbi:arginine deiminase-related protein [Wenyingzhuangia sp. IMCC45467]
MILIDFRNWIFDKSLGFLPNAQKQLLQMDFDALTKLFNFDILDLGVVMPFSVSDLFFKNKEQIAVSAVKSVSSYYEIIDLILEKENKEIVDYTQATEEEVYFYGQNSLVAHFETEIALCGINQFTDESLFEEYCEDFELTPFSFNLPDDLLTRDVACFVGNTLWICLDYITDKKDRKQLFSILKNHGIKTVTFTKEQVVKGVFDLKSVDGKLLISKKSFDLFTETQKAFLPDIEIVDCTFLEKAGIKLRDIIL